MKYTDLLLLDLKEINPARHKDLTGFDNSNIIEMAKYLSEINKPVWIRHVLVPEHSDFDEDLDALGDFIDTLSNVDRVEILPYHTLGKIQVGELRYSLHFGKVYLPHLPNALKMLNSEFTQVSENSNI